VERSDEDWLLCLHYDPNLVSLDRLTRLAEKAGGEVGARYRHETYDIEGMDCADCASSIEHLVSRLKGVLSVAVSYAAEKIRLEYDSEFISLKEIGRRLSAMGYALREPEKPRGWLSNNRDLVLSLLCGLLLVIGYVGQKFFALAAGEAIPIYVLALVAGGYDATRHGLSAAIRFRFDIEFLMVIAAIGASSQGAWDEAALLLFLFSFGHALESYAMNRARSAMKALGAITPKTAVVLRQGVKNELPVDELQRGDTVFVKNGERLPVDGIISKGTSSIDQSPVTGESVPVDKSKGDDVFAGTINGEGTLEIEVTKLAKDTTISRIVQMVEEAESQKSASQLFTERFTRVFVPCVLVLVVAVITLPPLMPSLFYLSWKDAFMRAMAVLVGASPCALAIATPSAVLAGVAQAARMGVLVKGGMHLENLGTLRAIAFDKTGTLTKGEPEVTDVLPCKGVESEELLRICASVEAMSSHPLAQAVVRRAQADAVRWPQAQDVVSITGHGARAMVEARETHVGNSRLFENGGGVSGEVAGMIEKLQAEGRTTIIVRYGDVYLGVIGLADQVREEVPSALSRLKQLGINSLIMLTGDNKRVAASVAGQVGLTEYRAELMPEDKVAEIQNLVATHGKVAMVGDGINDAPAMKNATVGIAMGAGGTDVALETADIALMSDDLSKLPFAVGLSRKSRSIILQNLFSSLAIVCVLVVTALIGITSMGVAIVVHEGSTLAVVGNALRLLRFKLRQQ
jgi:Cd2+/Zn2+-exporting ATPase